MRARYWTTLLISLGSVGCNAPADDAPLLSREHRLKQLEIGEARPPIAESEASGSLTSPIKRGSKRFEQLVECRSPRVVFKNEEGTNADRMMTPRLRSKLDRLGERIGTEWVGLRLRVTEAWDEDGEHSGKSLHYEGRAADLTTSDRDPDKLGRLAALAAEVGFDWVYRERTHVHVSVR
jgi:hypothetical protein